MILVIAGMIGTGKSSVAKALGEEFKSEVFYESVEDNKILPLFYTATDEEIQAKRYPFLLQLWFLNTRFKSIKQALIDDNNVLDRSIYEDLYYPYLRLILLNNYNYLKPIHHNLAKEVYNNQQVLRQAHILFL